MALKHFEKGLGSLPIFVYKVTEILPSIYKVCYTYQNTFINIISFDPVTHEFVNS